MNNTPAQAREIVAKALESGEYTQGKRRLECCGNHCCLGVATREFMRHEDVPLTLSPDTGSLGDCTSFIDEQEGTDSSIVLIPTVQRWLGFRGQNGRYGGACDGKALSADNDDGMTFDAIAEKFRNPPEGLLA